MLNKVFFKRKLEKKDASLYSDTARPGRRPCDTYIVLCCEARFHRAV